MTYSTSLFDNDGRPTNPFLKLLDLFDVQHDGSLCGIRDATQREWYQEGKLRAEIIEKSGHKKEEAMPILVSLGFISAALSPARRSYVHALLLGATVTAVRKRLVFLCNEWERGVRFKYLYLLGSERPLLADRENESILLDSNNTDLPFDPRTKTPQTLPANEAEMMALVYDQAKARLPWEVPMEVITTKAEGRNANTMDTLEDWNRRVVKGGPCLVVSSQPFVTFQELMARKVLDERHGVIKGVGYKSPDLPVTTYLDNVSKIVFELAKEKKEDE